MVIGITIIIGCCLILQLDYTDVPDGVPSESEAMMVYWFHWQQRANWKGLEHTSPVVNKKSTYWYNWNFLGQKTFKWVWPRVVGL